MIAQYKISFETPDYFGEANVEVSYTVDDEGYEFIDKTNVQYDDIILTNKKTRKSEFANIMPDEVENYAIEAADDQFTTEEKDDKNS